METIRVDYLADHMAFIPTVAEWHHHEWGHLAPGSSLDQHITQVTQTCTRDAIPLTFVAVAGHIPVGCASLIHHDLTTRMELSPWLASVYVAPEYRRQGIGSRLVRQATEKARELRVERLYLITPDQESFYRRLGWSTVGWTHYRGEDVAIMDYLLSSQVTPGAGRPTRSADRHV